MRIKLNGTDIEIEGQSLRDLVEAQGFSADAVATAVNESFVAQSQRAYTQLNEGDRVEILGVQQGG